LIKEHHERKETSWLLVHGFKNQVVPVATMEEKEKELGDG